nr:penicillin-binding transpeptidase domain-containing protein [Maliibacterium massiliense]
MQQQQRPSNTKGRFVAVGVVVCLAFSMLMVELFNLQLRQGDVYASQSNTSKTRTITLKGMRGKILDTNGQVLAYDKQSYNVAFVRDPSKKKSEDNAAYTQVLMQTIAIVEENGGSVIDTFSIKRGEDGTLAFNFGEGLTEEAAAKRLENYRKNMFIGDKYKSAQEVYDMLLERYQIPAGTDEALTRKLLSIWQEVQLNSYKSYLPIVIAKDVDMQTVAVLETRSSELAGITIEEGTTRVYPKGEMAAHIVGYLGRMVDQETLDTYKELGYGPDDLIGVAGLEAAMEAQLSASGTEKQGKRVVEVNSLSKVTRELSYEAPQNGNNVVTTLDLNMQKVLEDALAANIAEINEVQKQQVAKNPAKYNQLVAERDGIPIKYAETGAAVVLDVNTGKVLAMCSYPSYDVNLFTGGISEENYAALMNDTRTPMFNKAIASKTAPGSVFKMATSTAALMEGAIGFNDTIVDRWAYAEHGIPASDAPTCWAPRGTHGAENVITALRDSCNYYFYEVAYRTGNDALVKWSDALGLTSKTGIEIPGEVAGQVASPSVVYDPSKSLDEQLTGIPHYIAGKVRAQIRKVTDKNGITYSDEALNAGIQEIFAAYAAGENASPAVRKALSETIGIPESIVRSEGLVGNIVPLLRELRWSTIDTITTGIGQSKTALTPIGVARYVAALVNGGKVLQTQVVDQVVDNEGNVLEDKQPVVSGETGISADVIAAIKEGMRQVVLTGTARSLFKDFPYKNDMGAKTGTAQTSDIDIEDNSWFVAFAPYENPEIAIAVAVPNGLGSGLTGHTAQAVIQYYMDRKKPQPPAGIDAAGTVTP